MFQARNHADFNTHFNKAAGSSGVAYSAPWNMRTSSGKAYLHNNYVQTGRMLAAAILDGKCTQDSNMHNGQKVNLMTQEQKACLTLMRDSMSKSEFVAGLRGAVRCNALDNVTMQIFAPQASLNPAKLFRTLPAAKVQAKSNVSASAAPAVESVRMEVDQGKAKQTQRLVDKAPEKRMPHLVDQSANEVGTLRVKKRSKKA